MHIYEDPVETLQVQIQREPLPFPKMKFTNLHSDIDDYDINDIEWIEKYKHQALLKMKMSA